MKYRIKMLKDSAPALKRFMSYRWTMQHGGVDGDDYETVYDGEIEECATVTQTLDAIYHQLNHTHPEDYKHRSLSVSDVIILPGSNNVYFVDNIGFIKIF